MKLIKVKYLQIILPFFILLVFFTSCKQTTQKKVAKETNQKEPTLFTLLDNSNTNIHQLNKVTETLQFNFLNYSYIYNGAGVAVGDINNDGLEDIYFSSNQGSNKLYINKGNFKFEDITKTANVTDEKGWSTGVTMVDVNNDGWLDIYVCKSGSLNSHELRKNKLFINQKDNTFIEKAKEYGLDHYGFSTQAYFFDYDLDGDLDMYLVNHRQDFRNNIQISSEIQRNKQEYNSDQLFRNDGNRFTNVTKQAGVENKAWGLSASIGDFNNDNLPDIYVANDFLEPDFLYINQGDGTFKDEILKRLKHISFYSMGSDYADFNNDLNPDLVVLDMMAEDHIRSKENMATMSTENFNAMVKVGYHHQYMSNVLQLNNGDGTYSEIGQLAGINKTDWSWAPLIADFDNDGFKDLFVTNGIENDLSNQDFRSNIRNNISKRKKISLDEAIGLMPSSKLHNYMFKNNTDLTFTNVSKKWGFDKKINSNGAVYVDLDNDGDLDIIMNNQSEEATIYKNNSTNNYISFTLKGSPKNTGGIGARIYVFADDLTQFKQHYTSRGYQSSVTNKIHFGLGNKTKVDSVKIIWNDGKEQIINKNRINSTSVLDYKNAHKKLVKSSLNKGLFTSIEPKSVGINYQQKENEFDDYKLQLLLPQKQSEQGKAICVGDVNNDGLDDFFVGNAKDQVASLFIQKSNGKFVKTNQKLFERDKFFEDSDAQFFDADNDGDLDLYVASGSYEITENSAMLLDRLYENDGKGNFKRTRNLPQKRINSKKIVIADFDNDNDLDIFICGGVKHGKYPLSDTSYLLENNNGKFSETTTKIKGLETLNISNDALFTDYDNDGDLDLIVVGEWMPITLFENNKNVLSKKELADFTKSEGWYQSITAFDFNNDGLQDYIVGNWGNNNKFHPTKKRPLHIYADYLDKNETFDVVLSKVSKTGKMLPVRGKECSSQQTPFLQSKIKTYKDFASSTLSEIYGEDKLKNATHLEVYNFNSMLLLNKGNGQFEKRNLPNQAQMSPLLSVEIFDVKKDGNIAIFGVGNVYDAEVETIRYDASRGFVLLADNGNFTAINDISYLNQNEAKVIKSIKIKGNTHFLIFNKNSELKIVKLLQ